MTVQEELINARKQLEHATAGGCPVSTTPALDAYLLLSCASGLSRAVLMAHPDYSADEWSEQFHSFIARRLTGEPVAYITGNKEFWGMDFAVSPAVLIPRADTEILVERALAVIGNSTENPVHVLDACTGSGCVAIALAATAGNCEITAFDISPGAIAVARQNARTLLDPARNIRFLDHDLRTGLPPSSAVPDGRYSLIVSNPPYVPADIARNLLKDGRGEPLLALDGGTDGLDLVRVLADHAATMLNPGGTLLIETGEYNAKDAAEYLKQHGFAGIVVHPDLAGQDRVVEGVKP